MKNHGEMPDEKLIQFYLSNNPAALATLTDLYKDRIYAVIYATVKNKYAAEIIFREVFVRIINHMITGKNPEHLTFLQWATDLAQQLCLEYNYKIAKTKIQGDLCDDTGSDMDVSSSLPQKTYYDNHTKLRQAIYMLPGEQRDILILNHYAGVSFREIATKMKCSVTNALDIMKHALTSLRSLLTEQEVVLN